MKEDRTTVHADGYRAAQGWGWEKEKAYSR